MGASACLAMPKDLGAINVSDMLALPSLPSEQSAKRLSVSADELIRNIASVADELVGRVIEKRTAVEFIAARNEVFLKYFNAVRSFSDLARIVVPKDVLETMTEVSLGHMEAEFRAHGLTAFGADVRDQAIFTLATMRTTNDICQRIDSIQLAPELAESDVELRTSHAFNAVGARFHLDCLMKAMYLRKQIYPDVLNLVMDGLRSAVNAYGWAVRGLDLRVPRPEVQLPPVVWDDEDEALLAEATNDVMAEY
jgi:hypothetical protein